MTAALPYTEASIRRRIKAAKKEGLRVVGIAPDGTVLVDGAGGDQPAGDRVASEAPGWEAPEL